MPRFLSHRTGPSETPDRYDYIVLAKGMDDSQFALNPIVTLNHDYSIPPIGRSLWRKFVKDALPTVTREERAKAARDAIATRFTSKQQAFLDFVLA